MEFDEALEYICRSYVYVTNKDKTRHVLQLYEPVIRGYVVYFGCIASIHDDLRLFEFCISR